MAKEHKHVYSLIETLNVNGLGEFDLEWSDHRTHELGRLRFHEGQLLVLYKSGTALVQGKGPKANIAEVCRAEEWRCSG